LTVADVMTLPDAIVPPDATILEVVFLLSVKGHPKVYVVDDDRRLLGVIDRIRVLARIFDL
jgi:CBS domain-containing protein